MTGTNRKTALRVAAVLLLLGCAPLSPPQAASSGDSAVPQREPATFPAEWQHPAGQRAAFAEHGMVAANNRLGSEVGAEILRAGGNAVDAAVATGFALAVTYPQAGNLGGGGFMLIRMADGRTAALDYREVAPLSATRDMYVAANGKVTTASLVGPLASGVPGSVAGMLEALRRWGTMPREQVMAPAIRLAEDGFTVDSVFSASVGRDTVIPRFAGAARFLAQGVPPRVGSVFKQPELGRTLRLIARDGAPAFYNGEIARQIAAEMQRDGGNITLEDLRRYKPIWRAPLKSEYRGYSLLMMPPASSGGITIGETFNILEALGPEPAFGSPQHLHLLASAYQRSFIDRNSKLGDPDFVKVPAAQLLSKQYAQRLAANIGRDRATPTPTVESAMSEGNETTHYSVVDASGNAVAVTTTLNELYGSGVYIRDAGFFMNDEMDDFTAKPGSPNIYGLVQGASNSIEPGKRMLSAMAPTIVLDPAGNLLLVIGAHGGPRIITNVSQVIQNVIDYRMSLADAISAPRIHYQALPDVLKFDSLGFSGASVARLRQMGYTVLGVKSIGAEVTGIMRVRGGYEGFDDPRERGGGAVGF